MRLGLAFGEQSATGCDDFSDGRLEFIDAHRHQNCQDSLQLQKANFLTL